MNRGTSFNNVAISGGELTFVGGNIVNGITPSLKGECRGLMNLQLY